MNKRKIINDPIYGFVSIPYDIIYDIMEHPYFQRLRRIKQLGLTHYVYPGALHTRFHHALGAMHLMTQAIDVLRSKGVDITKEEAEAVTIAILMHDAGHGPFSHALEHTLVNVHHEELSILFMQYLNKIFKGKLSLAITIFKNKYHKPFLYQLISGQLDMDRMDYLNRDSFFTGVHEGVIGYDRIIKMLNVHEGELVVEEKGIYSIEKFLIARRLMYWQAYLHKTVLSAEQMLIRALRRAKELASKGVDLNVSESLRFFLYNDFLLHDFEQKSELLLKHYANLDDFDIISALKSFKNHSDFVLSYLAKSLINRQLFRTELQNIPFEEEKIQKIHKEVEEALGRKIEYNKYLVFKGTEYNSAYSTQKDEIKIYFKSGLVKPMSECSDYGIQAKVVLKYYLVYPKIYK